MTDKKRVVVGLSGGVDSSVAAALLLEQGYEVSGVYLECYNEPGCRTDQDKKDALQVAIGLGIKFQVLDFRKEYKERVIEYFYKEYEAGRTPNPDVMCNREIKFGIFFDWSRAQGYDFIATGHYARITNQQTNKLTNQLFLQMARDESKDQSYFLWQIPQDHLAHILFPLGEMLKSEVRAKASEMNLLTANKPDSMGICFIGDINVHKLLREKLGERLGDVVMYPAGPGLAGKNTGALQGLALTGIKIGRHKGLWFYTIGSRGGFTIESKYQKPDMEPLYVIAKDKKKNELIVGTREETMRSSFKILDSRFEEIEKEELWVRIRNLGELIQVQNIEDNVVTLSEKVFGVAEGQSAVFYDKDRVVVGGSVITN